MTDYKNILIGGEQEHQSIKTDGICTCLCSSMGCGGRYVPMIVMTDRARNKKQETRNDTVLQKLCQHNLCRKYQESKSGLGRKCLLLSGCKSNNQGKRLQRSVTDSDKKIKRQIGVDLCFIESRLVEISACVCVRYDAGICKHKMEHTGVLIEYK